MTLFNILLALHITGGSIGLAMGTWLLADRKGGHRHVILGRVYFWALLASSFVALPMAVIHPNPFLFIIGVFTAYMLLSGVVYIRRRGRRTGAAAGDWMLTGVMAMFGAALVAWGVHALARGEGFGSVAVTFGGVSLLFVWQDWRAFRGEAAFTNWHLTTHLQRMLGSYIASLTAFLVVNNTMLPGLVAWLLPTLLVTPLIGVWTKKWGLPRARSVQAEQSAETGTTG